VLRSGHSPSRDGPDAETSTCAPLSAQSAAKPGPAIWTPYSGRPGQGGRRLAVAAVARVKLAHTWN
jgi:hypothetical protein